MEAKEYFESAKKEVLGMRVETLTAKYHVVGIQGDNMILFVLKKGDTRLRPKRKKIYNIKSTFTNVDLEKYGSYILIHINGIMGNLRRGHYTITTGDE